MIDNDAIAQKINLALKALEGNVDHGNRVIASLSNRLVDEQEFVAYVIASYRQLLEHGVTTTNVALTICAGIVFAHGADAFGPASQKPPDDIDIPPGTLLQ
jgi:hypothetical protein